MNYIYRKIFIICLLFTIAIIIPLRADSIRSKKQTAGFMQRFECIKKSSLLIYINFENREQDRLKKVAKEDTTTEKLGSAKSKIETKSDTSNRKEVGASTTENSNDKSSSDTNVAVQKVGEWRSVSNDSISSPEK